MLASASSSAASVNGDALMRLLWAVLVTVVALVAKKELEKVIDLSPVRPWLRKIVFDDLLLRNSRPSDRADRLAQRLGSWLSGLSRIPSGAIDLLDPEGHERGVREVVICAVSILWGAYTRARRVDRTLQFGMWIRFVGVATLALGIEGSLAGQPWASHEIMLGATITLVGHYLGALRSRGWLWFALLAVGPLLITLDSQYQVSESLGFIGAAILNIRRVGSLLAAAAGVAVALGKIGAALTSRSSGARRAITRTTERLVWFGMRCAGFACICYMVANLAQTVTVAPTVLMQATHAVIAIFLAMAARESRHPTDSYPRLTGSGSI